MIKNEKLNTLLKKFFPPESRGDGSFLPEIFKGNLKVQWEKFFPQKSKGLLAVNFGSTMAEIVYLEPVPGHFNLLAYEVKETEHREEEKEKMRISFIKDFINKNSISDKDIILSISDSSSVVVKDLILPVLSEEATREAIKEKLKEDVPFDLNSAAIDWQVIGERADDEEEDAREDVKGGAKGDAKKRGIISIVIEKEVIDKYVSVIRQCDLNPSKITSGPFNYARVFKDSPQSPATFAVLDVGHQDSTLTIYVDGKLNFVRRLPISLEKFTRSLTGVLVTAQGKVELSPEEARDIKNNFGVPFDETQFFKDNIPASSILSLVRPLLEALVRDLRLSFNYFASNFNTDCPSLFYITGDGANLKNLDKYLDRELDMKVSQEADMAVSCLPLPGVVKNQVRGEEGLPLEIQNKISNVIGAALRDFKEINLLPLEIKMHRAELLEKAFLRVLAITMGAIFLFLLFVARFQVRDYENRLKNVRQHLQTIEGIVTLDRRVRAQEALVEKIQEEKVPVAGLLKVISNLIPEQILLENFSLDQGSHALSLRGMAWGRKGASPVVTDFIQKLEASSFFAEVDLIGSQHMESTQKFELRCAIVH